VPGLRPFSATILSMNKKPLSAEEIEIVEKSLDLSVRLGAIKVGLNKTRLFNLRERYNADKKQGQLAAPVPATPTENDIPQSDPPVVPISAVAAGNDTTPTTRQAKAKKKDRKLTPEQQATIKAILKSMPPQASTDDLTTIIGKAGVPALWAEATKCKLLLKQKDQEEAELKTEWGFYLLAAKAKTEHGYWLKDLRLYCSISDRTAERYMRVAEHCVPKEFRKFDTLPNSEPVVLPPEGRAAMKTAIAGRTMGTMYKVCKVVMTKPPLSKNAAVGAIQRGVGAILKTLQPLKKHLDEATAEQAKTLAKRLEDARELIEEVDAFLTAQDKAAESKT
jgi:hypothetical protein